ENRPLSLPFISSHFCIGEAFIKSPHKSLNTSATIIIFPHSLDFSRDKPYLFPLSSMTEEQKDEIDKFFKSIEGQLVGLMGRTVYLIDFFNKNHLDYRGLIKEGLAIDATGLGIYE
ncbi:MAG: hypothetical protein IJ456_11230, partial [Bacteroides sp.]|nr:hypothetical protein [Bacteroides sp.]